MTPTPTVIDLASGSFVLTPEIRFGEAGVMLFLFLVCGLLLMRIGFEVVAWFKR